MCPPVATEPRFPLHHGNVALSFAGTVADRGSRPAERLETPAALAAWLIAAKLVTSGASPSPAQLRRAVTLREAIVRAVGAVAAGAPPPESDVAAVNAAARRWASRPALDARTLTLVTGTRDPVDAALGRIAAETIALLGDPEQRSRLRACSLASCAAIFLTPPGRRERRWCSMERCGNRAKVSAFRARTGGGHGA